MCGRFNIIDDPLTQFVCHIFGIEFSTTSNSSVCPSESVATIGYANGTIQQINATWGIQPAWANRLLINAQSETVATKPTFKSSFENSRCLVPMSGWYEWKKLEHGKKQKYLFENDSQAMFMAGILFDDNSKFVTLTTEPTEQCAEYHHRMPLLINDNDAEFWLAAPSSELSGMLENSNQPLKVLKSS